MHVVQIQVGDRMRKVFGKRTFEGTVVSLDVCNETHKTMYHVVYEDDDEEDFYKEQLRPFLYTTSNNGACNEPCTLTLITFSMVLTGIDPMLRAQQYLSRRQRAIALFTNYPVCVCVLCVL